MIVNIKNTKTIVDFIISEHLKEGSLALDCTIGNGNDILKICQKIGKTGKVYGFDIQKEAIIRTSNLLNKWELNNFKLINDGHENIDKYISEKLDFIIYNLGYLPNGNKTITTNYRSTIYSLKKSLDLLKKNGMISITFYPGHEEGKKEYIEVINFLKTISQKEFNILELNFVNQINNPPILCIIERKD